MNAIGYYNSYPVAFVYPHLRIALEYGMSIATLSQLNMKYERIGYGEPLLMIMGIGAQLIHWPPSFCQSLQDEGFSLILPDNRDAGLTSQMSHLGKPNIPKIWGKAFLGLPAKAPYTLLDMAQDFIDLLDHLKISRCHLLGISMGSMISQILASQYPSRFQSITLLHSNSGKKRHIIGANQQAYQTLIYKKPIRNEQEYADYIVKLLRALGSPGLLASENDMRIFAKVAYNRGYHPEGFLRQLAAVLATSNREPFYSTIRQPTAIIHGAKDPLFPIINAQYLHQRIPNSSLHIFDDLGHDIPEKYHQPIAKIIRDLANQAP